MLNFSSSWIASSNASSSSSSPDHLDHVAPGHNPKLGVQGFKQLYIAVVDPEEDHGVHVFLKMIKRSNHRLFVIYRLLLIVIFHH